jgi:hypothetical protein
MEHKQHNPIGSLYRTFEAIRFEDIASSSSSAVCGFVPVKKMFLTSCYVAMATSTAFL